VEWLYQICAPVIINQNFKRGKKEKGNEEVNPMLLYISFLGSIQAIMQGEEPKQSTTGSLS
jgi:hypothetical protein